ncbi:MAG: flippase-like domain-containing protein [Alphaproteobacteria bacterium]|nr:flippase-like domain-containing protein [Alphaproteobacteria bacterium]
MKQWSFLFVKAAFTAGLIWWLVGRIGWDAVFARLQGLDVGLLSLAVLAVIVSYSLLIVRWWAVNKGISIALSFSQTIRLSWIGAFFSQTLPSTMGGDAVRIYYLFRSGETLVRATSSLVLDRVCGLSGLLLIVLFSLPQIFEYAPTGPARWGIAAVVAIGALAVAVLVLIGHYRIGGLDRWAMTAPIAAVARDAAALFSAPLALAIAIGVGVCIQLSIVVAVWLIGWSMGGVLSLAQSVAFVPPVVLAATMPISIAGWGVREGAMVVALGYVGVSAPDAVALSVALGLVMIVAGLPGGLVWLLSGRGEKLSPQPPK